MNLQSSTDLAKLALLAMFAEDMHRVADSVDKKRVPDIDERLSADWDVQAFLIASDTIFPPPGVKLPIEIKKEDPIYYGYVAKNRIGPAQFVVAVRGTEGIAEWIIDGQFLWVNGPDATKVEHGFWSIYNSMALVLLDGSQRNAEAAQGIRELVGAAPVTVIGHSLGSSLATYLSYDLAQQLGEQVQACMFASPRTGDQAWADLYHRTVRDYRVVNYILDVVPHLPTRPGYATLQNVLILAPSTADAAIRIDVRCNHHVICYCAMLDYATATGLSPKQVDLPCQACINGDKRSISNDATSMGVAVEAVASTAHHVSALFRAMFSLDL